VKPQGNTKCYTPGRNGFDRVAQQKKVKKWFLDSSKYCHEIESEQPGECIYHISKSHTTAECSIKKECDKIVTDKKGSTSSSPIPVGSSGHL
jgi:hypothetical protein